MIFHGFCSMIVISLVIISQPSVDAFISGSRSIWKPIKSVNCPVTILNAIKSKESQKPTILSKAPNAKSSQVYTPSKLDNRISIGVTLAGQGVLLGVGLVMQLVYAFWIDRNYNGIVLPSFDPESMKTALFFAAPLIAAGLTLDNLPFQAAKDVHRDSRFYALRLLGRQSSIVEAVLTNVLLAATAGFAEEFLFRGVVYNTIENSSGDFSLALIASSIIFGLAHWPIWGSNPLVETVLGVVLGFAYHASGHNLGVPIAIHTLYDFTTHLVAWYIAQQEMKKSMSGVVGVGDGKKSIAPTNPITGELKRIQDFTSTELDAFSAAIFGMLDFNKDGYVDSSELDAGLKLYEYEMYPFNLRQSETATIFARADTNNDGVIGMKEFKAVIKSDIQDYDDGAWNYF